MMRHHICHKFQDDISYALLYILIFEIDCVGQFKYEDPFIVLREKSLELPVDFNL